MSSIIEQNKSVFFCVQACRYKAIENFASNPDIIICKPDKGRSVVILDKVSIYR